MLHLYHLLQVKYLYTYSTHGSLIVLYPFKYTVCTSTPPTFSLLQRKKTVLLKITTYLVSTPVPPIRPIVGM